MDEQDDDLVECLETIGVPHIRRHIFICAAQTKPKCCDTSRGSAAWEHLIEGQRVEDHVIHDRGPIDRRPGGGRSSG